MNKKPETMDDDTMSKVIDLFQALKDSLKETAAKHEARDASVGLECDHCGGTAITSNDGLFSDGDGGTCDDCGFPGHVSADAEDAYWMPSEDADARCTELECVDCEDIDTVAEAIP